MKSYTYFLGIDIAKESFDVALLKIDSKKVLKTKHFKMNHKGFYSLSTWLDKYADSNNIFIGMESTGSYHITILNFLVNKDYDVALINPKLIKSFSESITLRNSINDTISSKHIAQFTKINYDELQTVSKDSITSLKPLIRERENILESITQEKNRITDLLNRVFPELSRVTNLFSQTIINMLRFAPSARKIREKGLFFVQTAIANTKGGKIKASAKDIFNAAQNSIGISDQYIEDMLLIKLKHLEQLKETLSEIESLINKNIESNNAIKKKL